MAGIWDFLTKKKKPEDGSNDLQAVVNPAANEKKNFLSQFLPEDETKREALSRALLMGGASMMAGGGPSATPTNLLGIIGQGLGTGVGTMDEYTLNKAKMATARAATSNDQMKLQTIADSQARGKAFAEKYGAPGPEGYSQEALHDLLQIQMANGDEAGARDTVGMINQLQQAGARQGMVVGEDGKFGLAGGYAGSLFDTKSAESLGSAVGQNAQTTSDRKNFEFGNENPAFRDYETSQRKASAATTNINNAGPKEGKIFEGMDEERKNAQNARSSLGSIYEAKQAIKAGAVTGFGAETELAARKAAAKVFGIGEDAIENTETFRSAVAPMVATILKDTVGSANISNSDREFAEKAAGGSIALDASSISRLLDIQEKIQTDKITRFNSRVNDLYPDVPENKGTRTYFGDITVPENPFTGKEKIGSVSKEAASGDNSDGVGVVVVGNEAAYEKLPAGASYRFDADPVGTVRTKR
jgi:hypothetical protein